MAMEASRGRGGQGKGREIVSLVAPTGGLRPRASLYAGISPQGGLVSLTLPPSLSQYIAQCMFTFALGHSSYNSLKLFSFVDSGQTVTGQERSRQC